MKRYPKTSWLLLLLFLVAFSGNRDLARAQEQPPANGQTPATTATPSTEEDIQAKIDELQPRIKTFAEAETEEVAQALNVTLEQLRERTEILQETQNYYIQHLQALRKHESLLQEKEALQEKIATGEALKLETEPPYSLKTYDDYNARFTDSKRDLDMALMAVAVAQNALEDTRDRLTNVAARTRSLKSADGQGKDQQEILQNQWLYKQSEREEALATAVLGYQEQALANAKVEAGLASIKADLAEQISKRIRENLHFDQSDLEQQLAAIDEGRQELQSRVEAIRNDLRRTDRAVLKARLKLEQGEGDSEIAAARTDLAVGEQWQQTYRVKLEQAENILQQMGTRKQLWKQRYDLIKGDVQRRELADLRQEAGKLRDRFQQTIALEQERQTNLQLQIGKLEDQLQQEGLDWGAKSHLNEQRQALREQVNSTIEFLTATNKTARINLQFIEEVDRTLRTFSLDETIKTIFVTLQGWWNAELLVVDNQALTVSKVIIALGILILGIIIAGIISRLLHKRLLGRFRLSGSDAAIIAKLVKYTAVLVVIVFAMSFVNIPLTVFTFMGGAIALGVGFGAQKLINNFISGFIIMLEQPVRVGDLIMVDNESGWIEDIGVRSTRVRTYANTNILVPNSYFLENNIINWTHYDNVVRGRVAVGVAYGSSTREVKEILLRCAEEHGEIRKEPESYVWFADFGDNSLIFELYFWVMVTEHSGIQRVASDLRFMIDRQFQDAGITIAFPQRELHFDRENPLKVEISRAGRKDGAA
jgi:small-conductance mechanosensitive channel